MRLFEASCYQCKQLVEWMAGIRKGSCSGSVHSLSGVFFFFFAPCLHWLDKPSDWSFTRLLKSTEVGTTHLIFKIFLLLTPPQSSQTNQKDATVTWWHSQNPSSWAPRHHFEGYKAKPCDIWTASKSPPWHAGLLQGEWLLSMLPQQPPPPGWATLTSQNTLTLNWMHFVVVVVIIFSSLTWLCSLSIQMCHRLEVQNQFWEKWTAWKPS